MFKQLGLIGCGLMGGSFALALKRAGLVKHVVGYSKSPSTVIQAQKMGVVDQAAESALLAVSGADIVLIAVPVAATEPTFRAIRHLVNPNVLFMDVGSTKGNVVDAARRVLKERLRSFVPAHPIAGKEVAGIAHADATLYQDCQVVLTPTVETDMALIERARAAWMGIGAQVRTMTPEGHDAAFAAVSHLPHLLAFSAYLAVAHQPEGRLFLDLAGPGFRDFTRIAASDATVWRDILLANRAQVLAQAEQFKSTLFQFEAAMREGQAEVIERLIKEAAQGRASWQPAGPRDSS
jgi:prephenate dehydrogenase